MTVNKKGFTDVTSYACDWLFRVEGRDIIEKTEGCLYNYMLDNCSMSGKPQLMKI